MNHHFTTRTRAAAIGIAILAASASMVGSAQAILFPVGPGVLGPTAADISVSRLVVSSQADNVHRTLRDLRNQLTTAR